MSAAANACARERDGAWPRLAAGPACAAVRGHTLALCSDGQRCALRVGHPGCARADVLPAGARAGAVAQAGVPLVLELHVARLCLACGFVAAKVGLLLVPGLASRRPHAHAQSHTHHASQSQHNLASVVVLSGAVRGSKLSKHLRRDFRAPVRLGV